MATTKQPKNTYMGYTLCDRPTHAYFFQYTNQPSVIENLDFFSMSGPLWYISSHQEFANVIDVTE